VFDFVGFVIALVALLSLLALAEGRRVMVVLLYPIVFVAMGDVSILISYVLCLVIGIPYSELYNSEGWKVTSELLFLLLILIPLLVSRKLRAPRKTIEFSIPQYLITLLGFACLFFVVGLSQGLLLEETELSMWIQPLSIALVVVGVIFIVLTLWQVGIEKRALQYKAENEYYQLCLKNQEEHIREIVENDQKMRRFRHDVNAHLTALEECVRTNNMSQLKSYVDRMREETSKLEVRKFTGIGVVDAIISEWYKKAGEGKIRWEWDGGLIGNTEVEAFDLCVIFSNLLSNAVEAAEQVEDEADRYIRVSCGTFRDRISVRIINSCRDRQNAGLRHGTTKQDYRNHGFGLLNIRNTVEKLNGEFLVTDEPGVFTAEVIL